MKEICFPVTFMDIETLANRWDCGLPIIQTLAECGQLKLYIRPVALEIALEDTHPDRKTFQALCEMPLNRRDIYRLFKDRHTHIQITTPNIPQTTNTIYVDFRDLIIPTENIEEFEQRCSPNTDNEFDVLSADFSCFLWHGREYTFGPMQAKVIKQLWQARENGTPWVYGKHLLRVAGSSSDRIQNLFSGNSNWRKLIVTDNKGRYKLNLSPKFISA